MMTIEHNMSRFQQRIAALGPKADDLFDNILRTSANYMVKETKKRFVNQRGPDGTPWLPLSGLTIRAREEGLGKRATRRSRGFGFAGGHLRLLDTGALMKSIVPRRTSKMEIAVETNIPYAPVHQKGASYRRTEKQAWWMILNLMYPDMAGKRWEDINKLPVVEREAMRIRMFQMRKAQKTLLNRPQVIPATPFMGINSENERGMAKGAAWHVTRFFNEMQADW